MATLVAAQSQYQRIEITDDVNHPGEIILWLDGIWQFGSYSEYKYHEAIVTLPMCVAPQIDKVLLCGAGDGLALREALRFKECIPTLVELDAGMLTVFKLPAYAKYNQNSLSHERAKIFIGNAIQFLNDTPDKFNLVVWDFPSPIKDKKHANLYIKENIEKALNCLTDNGVFVSQVSMPSSTLCGIIRELFRQDYRVWKYESYYDLNGNHDSFIVASKIKLYQQRQVPENCRFATQDRVKAAFSQATELGPDDLDYMMYFEHIEDFE